MSTAPEVKKADKAADKKAARKVGAASTEKAGTPVAEKPAAKKAERRRTATRPALKKRVPRIARPTTAADGTVRPLHNQSRLAQVLVAPIVSEKATYVAEKRNQFLFQVLRDATKPEIKAAVELMFKVDVESVQTVQHKGKTKRFGKSTGRRDHVKKAYVSLAAGQELNFSGESA